MGRLLPIAAIVLLSFAAGAAWMRWRGQRDGDAERDDGSFALLWWVPVGAAVALGFVAALVALFGN